MELILVRHAKSLHDHYVKNDRERHLFERGYQDAALSADWCVANKVIPDFLVSSPAIRAFSTAMIFAEKLSYSPEKIILKDAIYNAECEGLLLVLRETMQKDGIFMFFGHNPGFTDLLNYLCGPVCANLPTASVVQIKLTDKDQGRLEERSGKILRFFSGHKSFLLI